MTAADARTDVITKLTIEYDGAGFSGWARQPGARTVQEELERALETVLREPLTLSVAGRTDRGVHAWEQVASYQHEAIDPQRLNGLLPVDIAVLSAEPAAESFDARRDARSRTYCYRIITRRTRSVFRRTDAWWWPRQLDLDALRACAQALGGTHDFTAFTPTETEHSWFRCDVRRAEWLADGETVEFWIEADMFLRHMNRVLVATMLDVAEGNRTLEEFCELLEGRSRSEAGRTAPAHGLALASVTYSDSTAARSVGCQGSA